MAGAGHGTKDGKIAAIKGQRVAAPVDGAKAATAAPMPVRPAARLQFSQESERTPLITKYRSAGKTYEVGTHYDTTGSDLAFIREAGTEGGQIPKEAKRRGLRIKRALVSRLEKGGTITEGTGVAGQTTAPSPRQIAVAKQAAAARVESLRKQRDTNRAKRAARRERRAPITAEGRVDREYQANIQAGGRGKTQQGERERAAAYRADARIAIGEARDARAAIRAFEREGRGITYANPSERNRKIDALSRDEFAALARVREARRAGTQALATNRKARGLLKDRYREAADAERAAVIATPKKFAPVRARAAVPEVAAPKRVAYQQNPSTARRKLGKGQMVQADRYDEATKSRIKVPVQALASSGGLHVVKSGTGKNYEVLHGGTGLGVGRSFGSMVEARDALKGMASGRTIGRFVKTMDSDKPADMKVNRRAIKAAHRYHEILDRRAQLAKSGATDTKINLANGREAYSHGSGGGVHAVKMSNISPGATSRGGRDYALVHEKTGTVLRKDLTRGTALGVVKGAASGKTIERATAHLRGAAPGRSVRRATKAVDRLIRIHDERAYRSQVAKAKAA